MFEPQGLTAPCLITKQLARRISAFSEWLENASIPASKLAFYFIKARKAGEEGFWLLHQLRNRLSGMGVEKSKEKATFSLGRDSRNGTVSMHWAIW